MDSKEQQDWLEQMAHQVAQYLKDNHADKSRATEDNVFQPVPTMDICAALDITRLMFAPIKEAMVDLGYDIAFNAHGIYLGLPGESITYPAFCVKLGRAMAERSLSYMMSLGKTGKLTAAQKIAQIELGCRLPEIPAVLRSLGITMPKQLEEAWLALPAGDD